MPDSFEMLLDANWWSVTIYLIDKIIFVLYLAAVSYLFIFALGSNRNRSHKSNKKVRIFHRYVVIIFLDRRDTTVFETVDSFLSQDYPASKYQVIVVSNSNHEYTNKMLEEHQVRVILTPRERYSKTEAIQCAMDHLSADDFDVAVLMNDDSIVMPSFLSELNKEYGSTKSVAMQTHRVSRKLETDTALFGAVSEEINNSIFRLGHVNLGFSSALIGSGMVFKFSWLQENIKHLQQGDLVKRLETVLLEQSIFINYLNDVIVYSEKASGISEFNVQREAWIKSKTMGVNIILHKLPKAIIQGKFDYCNKLIQWLIPSRTILIGTLLLISIFLLFFSWGIAIKWIVVLLMLIVSFSIALPDYFIDARFIKALRGAPLMFMLTVINSLNRKLRIKKIEKSAHGG